MNILQWLISAIYSFDLSLLAISSVASIRFVTTSAIVGTQTYGKGVVQQIFDLKDGTCVKLTIAKYFTAKGQDIDGKGITPDVAIDYQADENNPEADNQLNKAIETLQGEMQ